MSSAVVPIFDKRKQQERFLSQDPWQRICMVMHDAVFQEAQSLSEAGPLPSWLGWLNRVNYLDRRLRAVQRELGVKAVSIEKEIVPFWAFSCMFKFFMLEFWPGKSTSRPSPDFIGSLGSSVAAVGPDHWCHGVVLPSQGLIELSFQVDQNTIHPVPLDVGAELSGLAEDEMYNNLFALHAPALTQDGIKNFLESSNPWSHKLEKSAGQRLVYRTKGEPITFALPTYRMAYKITMSDGSTQFMDSIDPCHFALPQTKFDWDSKVMHRFGSHWAGYATPELFIKCFSLSQDPETDPDGEGPFQYRVPLIEDPHSEERDVYPKSVRDALGGGRSSVNWADQRIFPLVPRQAPQKHTAYDIVEYLLIFGGDGQSSKPIPSFPIRKTAPNDTTSQPTSKASTHRRLRPPPLTAESSSRRPERPPREKTLTATSRPARPETDFRRRPEPVRLRPLGAAKGPKQEAAEQVPPPTLVEEAKYPLDVVVLDRKGYYRVMGVAFDRDFLEAPREAVCDRKIKLQYYRLSHQGAHPDHGGSSEQFVQMNEAYEKIKSLAGRRAYQDSVD